MKTNTIIFFSNKFFGIKEIRLVVTLLLLIITFSNCQYNIDKYYDNLTSEIYPGRINNNDNKIKILLNISKFSAKALNNLTKVKVEFLGDFTSQQFSLENTIIDESNLSVNSIQKSQKLVTIDITTSLSVKFLELTLGKITTGNNQINLNYQISILNSNDILLFIKEFKFTIKPNKCLNAAVIFENDGFTISYSKNYDYLTEVALRGGHFSIDLLVKFPFINSNSGVTDPVENLSMVKSVTSIQIVFGDALGTLTSSNAVNNTVSIANLNTIVPTFVFKVQNINLPFTSNLKYIEIIHISNSHEFPIESSDLITIDYSTNRNINSYSFTPLVTTNQSITNAKLSINYNDYLPKNAAVVFKFPKKETRFLFGLDNISINQPFEIIDEVDFNSIIIILSNNYVHSTVDSINKVVNLDILNLKLPMTTSINDSFEVDIYNSNNDLLYRSVNEVKFQATVNTISVDNFLLLPEVDTMNIALFKINFLYFSPSGSIVSLGFHSNVVFNYTSNTTPKACARIYTNFSNYNGLGSYYEDKNILINNLVNNNSASDTYYNGICNITSNTVKITLNNDATIGSHLILFLRFTNPRFISSTNTNVAVNVINNFSESLFNTTIKMPLFPKYLPIFRVNSTVQTSGFDTNISIFIANLSSLISNEFINVSTNPNYGLSVNSPLITSTTFKLFSYSFIETMEDNKRVFTINESSKIPVNCKIVLSSSISLINLRVTLQQAVAKNLALELNISSGITNVRHLTNDDVNVNHYFDVKASSISQISFSNAETIEAMKNIYRSSLISLYGENTPQFNDYVKQIQPITPINLINNLKTIILSPIVVYELSISNLTTSYGYFNDILDSERKYADYQFTIRPTIKILSTDIIKITFPKDIIFIPRNTVEDKFLHLTAFTILSDTIKIPMSLTHEVNDNLLSIYINFGSNFNPQVYQDLTSKSTSSEFDYNDLIRINVSGLVNPISFKETGNFILQILNNSNLPIAGTSKVISTKMTTANKFRYASISNSMQENNDYIKLELLQFNNLKTLDSYNIDGVSHLEMVITYPEDLKSDNLSLSCYVEVNKTNTNLPQNLVLIQNKFLKVNCNLNPELRIIKLTIVKELYYGNNTNTSEMDSVLNVVLNGLKSVHEELIQSNKITGNFNVEINFNENENVYKMENSNAIDLKFTFNCNAPCSACNSLSGKCTKCFNDSDRKILYNGECLNKCSNFTVLNPMLNICLECNSNCLTCSLSNKDKCLSCKSGDFMTDIFSCEKDCPVGYYKNTSKMTCSSCVSPCNKCINENICTDCNPNFSILYNNVCLLNCPSGTYLHNEDNTNIIKQNSKCEICSPECRTCKENKNKCTSCESHNILLNEQCLSACPNDHVYRKDINSCEKCPDNCSSCSLDENYNKNTCLKCHEKYFLKNGICINQVSSCPIRTFVNNSINECTSCSKNCKTCVNENTCTECEYGFLNSGKCSDECPSNFFNNPSNNNICTKCNFLCKTCALRSDNCTSCTFPFIFYDNSCIGECPLGYYKQVSILRNLSSPLFDIKFKSKRLIQSEGQCSKCPENCEKCYLSTRNNSNDSISCESCQNKFYLTPNLTCNAICPEGYINDDNGVCFLSNDRKTSMNLQISMILPISKCVFALLAILTLLIISVIKFKYDDINFSGLLTFWLYLVSVSNHIFICIMFYLTGFTDVFIVTSSIFLLKIIVNIIYLCILDNHFEKLDEKYKKTQKTNLLLNSIFQIYGFFLDFKIYKNFLKNYKSSKISTIKIDKVLSFEKINNYLSIAELFLYDILIIGFGIYYMIMFKNVSSHLWLLVAESLFVFSFSATLKIIDLIINHEVNRSYFSQKRDKDLSKRITKELDNIDKDNDLEENDVTLRLKQDENRDKKENTTCQNLDENKNNTEENNDKTNYIRRFQEINALNDKDDDFRQNLVKSENLAKNDTKENFMDKVGKTHQPRNYNLQQKTGISNFNDKMNYGSNNSGKNNSDFNSINDSINDDHNIPKNK